MWNPVKELKVHRIHVVKRGMIAWNPVKELKDINFLKLQSVAVGFLKWNPVKELKGIHTHTSDLEVLQSVESGEGIERNSDNGRSLNSYCASGIR